MRRPEKTGDATLFSDILQSWTEAGENKAASPLLGNVPGFSGICIILVSRQAGGETR